ncbi:MAG: hypothetical protein NTX26_01700, partial [Candidatus Parcubacteria bacterium]|nr:hypothetical protein [Candidatus Parcubacteria bacterium]
SLWGQISLENKVPFVIDNLLLGREANSESLLEETKKQKLLGEKLYFALWPYDYIPVTITRVIDMLKNGVLNLKNEIDALSISSIIGSQIPKELRGKPLKEIAANWSLDILETLQRLQELWPIFNLEILLPYTISSDWWTSTFTYTSLKTKFIDRGDAYTPNSLSGFVYFLTKFISKTSPELWPRYLAKITSQPALLAGLMNRGFLQKDYLADIVIINPDNLEAEGSYTNPMVEGSGIETVIINGHLVWHKGRTWEKGVGKLLI